MPELATQTPSDRDPTYKYLSSLVDEAITTRIQDYDRNNPLGEAMYYAMEAGGKRLRGAMALTAALQVGLPPQHLTGVALAVEIIHCYTLVHDDLPSMDNSPMRRGRASVHKAYGEAVALLAGNALLCDGILGLESLGENRWMVSKALLNGIGKDGVMLGQTLDMEAKDWTKATKEEVLRVHELKTVRLFEATMRAALAALGVKSTHEPALMAISRSFGFLLQWVDDLADDPDSLPRTEPSLVRVIGKEALAQKVHDEVAKTRKLIRALPYGKALGEIAQVLEEGAKS